MIDKKTCKWNIDENGNELCSCNPPVLFPVMTNGLRGNELGFVAKLPPCIFVCSKFEPKLKLTN